MNENKEKPSVSIVFQKEVKNYGTIYGDINDPIYIGGDSPLETTIGVGKLKVAMQQLNEAGIVSDDKQWYAIYKVLTSHAGFPAKISAFCEQIHMLKLDKEFEHKCVYENFRKVGTEIPHLPENVELWNDKITGLSEKELKQVVVARKLLELLGVDTEQ